MFGLDSIGLENEIDKNPLQPPRQIKSTMERLQ